MLKLYDDVEESRIREKEIDLSSKKDDIITDKNVLSGRITDKLRLSGRITDKSSLSLSQINMLTDILIYISIHAHATADDIATQISRSRETAKKYLQTLVAIEMITPEGGNKNRTYSIK